MEKNYAVRKIPKRSGGFRTIHEPCPELKLRQRQILRWLQSRGIGAGRHAHGFARGRSTATNAAAHVGKKIVLKADLEDFFPSTKIGQVRKALLDEGMDAATAAEIADTCTLGDALPQGAPTSPFLANLAFKRADRRLAALAEKYDAAYTRYADDLVFSSDNPGLNHILPALDAIVKDCGHALNRRKTKVMRSGRSQRVTGAVVNSKVNVPRERRRILRARLHRLRMSLFSDVVFDEGEFASAKGMAAYFCSLRPDLRAYYNARISEIEGLLEMRTAFSSKAA